MPLKIMKSRESPWVRAVQLNNVIVGIHRSPRPKQMVVHDNCLKSHHDDESLEWLAALSLPE